MRMHKRRQRGAADTAGDMWKGAVLETGLGTGPGGRCSVLGVPQGNCDCGGPTRAGTPQGTLTHRGPRLEQGMSEEEGEGEEKSKKPGMAARNHHVLTQPPVKTGWGRAGGREVLD